MAISRRNRRRVTWFDIVAIMACIIVSTPLACTHSGDKDADLSTLQGTDAPSGAFKAAVSNKFPKKKFLGAWGMGTTKGTARINARSELASQIQSNIDVAAYEFAQTGYSNNKDESMRHSTVTTAVSSSFKHGELIKIIDESTHSDQGFFSVYAVLNKRDFKRVLKHEYDQTASMFRPLCNRAEKTAMSNPLALCSDYKLMHKRFKSLENLAFQLSAVAGAFPSGFRSDKNCLASVNNLIASNEPSKLLTVNVGGTGSYQSEVYDAIVVSAARQGYSAKQGLQCSNGYILQVKGDSVSCREAYLGYQCEYAPSMQLKDCSGKLISSGILGPFKGVHPTDQNLARERMFGNKTATNLRQIKRTLGTVNNCGVISSRSH